MKIGLYSITFLGVWYKGKALTMPQVLDRAKEYGFDGVEIDGKRPSGNPMDWDCARRDAFRNQAEKLGLDIVGVASNNDFSSPVPEHRECQLLMVKEQIRMCADLGGKVVRLFGAWPGITYFDGVGTYDIAREAFERQFAGYPRLERWNHIRECLKEAADMAAEAGITVALQNHPPIIRHYIDVVDLVEEVDNPALKICLDAPMMICQDDDYIWKAARTVGDRQVHSHFGGEFYRDEEGQVQVGGYTAGHAPTNYPTFLKAMKEIGYDGYLCFEYCHNAVKGHVKQGIEHVEEQTKMALELMRREIAAVE